LLKRKKNQAQKKEAGMWKKNQIPGELTPRVGEKNLLKSMGGKK